MSVAELCGQSFAVTFCEPVRLGLQITVVEGVHGVVDDDFITAMSAAIVPESVVSGVECRLGFRGADGVSTEVCGDRKHEHVTHFHGRLSAAHHIGNFQILCGNESNTEFCGQIPADSDEFQKIVNSIGRSDLLPEIRECENAVVFNDSVIRFITACENDGVAFYADLIFLKFKGLQTFGERGFSHEDLCSACGKFSTQDLQFCSGEKLEVILQFECSKLCGSCRLFRKNDAGSRFAVFDQFNSRNNTCCNKADHCQ